MLEHFGVVGVRHRVSLRRLFRLQLLMLLLVTVQVCLAHHLGGSPCCIHCVRLKLCFRLRYDLLCLLRQMRRLLHDVGVGGDDCAKWVLIEEMLLLIVFELWYHLLLLREWSLLQKLLLKKLLLRLRLPHGALVALIVRVRHPREGVAVCAVWRMWHLLLLLPCESGGALGLLHC